MLDPTFVRDNLDAVRAGYASRGLDLDHRTRAAGRVRGPPPPADSAAREPETRAEHRLRRGGAGQAPGARRQADLRGQQGAQPEDQAAGDRTRRRRGPAQPADDRAPQPAARLGAGREERRRQRGRPHLGRAADLRLRAAGALGPGPAAGHHRLRAGDQDRAGALRGADRRRRAARTGADQLHADAARRPSTATPRWNRRSWSTAPPCSAPASCRSSSRTSSRSTATGTSTSSRPPRCRSPTCIAARSSTAACCRSSTPPTRRASAARPAPTAPTCAA